MLQNAGDRLPVVHLAAAFNSTYTSNMREDSVLDGASDAAPVHSR